MWLAIYALRPAVLQPYRIGTRPWPWDAAGPAAARDEFWRSRLPRSLALNVLNSWLLAPALTVLSWYALGEAGSPLLAVGDLPSLPLLLVHVTALNLVNEALLWLAHAASHHWLLYRCGAAATPFLRLSTRPFLPLIAAQLSQGAP